MTTCVEAIVLLIATVVLVANLLVDLSTGYWTPITVWIRGTVIWQNVRYN